MQKIEYDLPVFNDKDVADLNEYSQLVANALKVQIDKFGQPLTFKGTVDTMTDLQNIQTKTNGDIYEVKDIEQLYIYNGNEWVIYSDTLKIKIEGFDVIKVETLPTENIQEKTIYLVPNTQAKENNIYDEYIYINNTWEIIGTTAVDLSNYYNKEEVDNKVANIQALPTGGTTGQVLTKKSNSDRDASWQDNIAVNNTLSTSQTDTYSCDYINKLNEYSTEEHVIGTWFGKPLYSKVVICNGLYDGSGQKTFPSGVDNIDMNWIDIGKTFGSWKAFSTSYALPREGLDIGIIEGNIIAYTTNSDYSTWNAYVTINYTKTTD